MTRRSSGKINWGVFSLKLFLSLLAICVFIGIIYQGYILFTHQTSSVTGTILFLLGLGFWIWIVVLLRMPKYQYSKPSFWLVFAAVSGITLTCAFAGIEPLSSYKDEAIQKTASFTKTIADKIPIATTTANDSTGETKVIPITLSWDKIPDGYYESDERYLGRTITIKGATLTMDCKIKEFPIRAPEPKWPQMQVHTYEYKLHVKGMVEKPTALDKAEFVHLIDVVNGFDIDLPFKYMKEYNIIQLPKEDGSIESYRLK